MSEDYTETLVSSRTILVELLEKQRNRELESPFCIVIPRKVGRT